MINLRKNGTRALIWIAVMTAVPACSDYLDLSPTNRVTDEIAWTNSNNADMFLNNIYAGLPRAYNTADPVDNFSDDAIAGPVNQYSRTTFALSNYNSSNAPNYWTGNYANIRKCNLFLEKAGASALDEEWKRVRIAEARFLRAYFYHILW